MNGVHPGAPIVTVAGRCNRVSGVPGGGRDSVFTSKFQLSVGEKTGGSIDTLPASAFEVLQAPFHSSDGG